MDTSKQPGVTNSAEVAGTEVEASDERSRTSASEQFAPFEEHNLDKSTEVTTEVVPPARARNGGGPRTPEGKQKSKRNAQKYGIFSQDVLLEGESRADFNSMLSKLRDDLKPEGKVEEILVDKLAVILWRHRRVIISEGGEIRKETEFFELDQKRLQHDQMIALTTANIQCGGYVSQIANPEVVDKCLELFQELHGNIENKGFEEKSDKAILTRLYGNPEWNSRVEKTLLHFYSACLNVIRSTASDGKQSEPDRPEQYKNYFLAKISEQIEEFNFYKIDRALIEAHRTDVELLRRSVPDTSQLDRLIRYESHLERNFDRTLSQLERLQRTRKGQPVPPTLHVNVST
jgi:hypothetical protein